MQETAKWRNIPVRLLNLRKKIRLFDFTEMDMQITKFKSLRDSYRESNREYYGEHLASLLDD
jgi:hypothetical protein